jgi:hypothetical protein
MSALGTITVDVRNIPVAQSMLRVCEAASALLTHDDSRHTLPPRALKAWSEERIRRDIELRAALSALRFATSEVPA